MAHEPCSLGISEVSRWGSTLCGSRQYRHLTNNRCRAWYRTKHILGAHGRDGTVIDVWGLPMEQTNRQRGQWLGGEDEPLAAAAVGRNEPAQIHRDFILCRSVRCSYRFLGMRLFLWRLKLNPSLCVEASAGP